jgi:hypothetical protein
MGRGALTELAVPVADHVTEGGAAVLLPTRPVDEIVAEFLESGATAEVGVVTG